MCFWGAENSILISHCFSFLIQTNKTKQNHKQNKLIRCLKQHSPPSWSSSSRCQFRINTVAKSRGKQCYLFLSWAVLLPGLRWKSILVFWNITGASFCLFEKPLVEALEVAVCRVRLLWSGQVRSVMQIVMVVWENEREAGVC